MQTLQFIQNTLYENRTYLPGEVAEVIDARAWDMVKAGKAKVYVKKPEAAAIDTSKLERATKPTPEKKAAK